MTPQESMNEMAFTRGGKTFIGRWGVEDGLITVWLGLHGPHCTQLGGMPPEVLARVLLEELMGRTEAQAKTS
jgi:hypothetical protein